MLKDLLKKNKFLLYLIRRKRILAEYKNDGLKFYKNFFNSIDLSQSAIKFRILYLCHALEKGMLHDVARPYGFDKVNELVEISNKLIDKNCYEYNTMLSTLYFYKKFHIENKLEIPESIINKLDNLELFSTHKSAVIIKEYTKNNKYIDYDDLLSNRHSVRIYDFESKIDENEIKKCVESAIKTPSACNRQMVKVYWPKKREIKEYIGSIAHGISGFDKKNTNYFVITGDLAALQFVGERHEIFFDAGLFSMNLVNALHENGYGSCFIEFANTAEEEEKLKKLLNISSSEKVCIFIAFGKYKNEYKVTLSNRKKLEDILFIK